MEFIGFDESDRVDRVLGRVDIRPQDALPSLIRTPDVFTIPGLDALYDAAGQRIEIAKRAYVPDDLPAASSTRVRVEQSYGRFCPEKIDLPEQFDEIQDPVLFGGHAWSHYGHFLTDVMSRLWALPFVDARLPILYIKRGHEDFDGRPYSRLVADALKITGRLFSCARPTRLRCVYMPEPAIQHAFRMFHAHPNPHLEVTRSLSPQMDRSFSKQLIYLTRSGLSEKLRRSPQELALETQLERLGFLIARPEQLSVTEQIQMFNEAKLIAGMTGSAFHTSLFCATDPSPWLVQLSWNKINQRYIMIDTVKKSRAVYVKAGTITSIRDDFRVENVNLDVDFSVASIASIAARL